MQIDVFNGDADGICALLQLRHAKPCESQLITGIKRDIGLLSKVNAQSGDKITVLDISMKSNQSDLLRLLNQNIDILYIDHHLTGTIPKHPKLNALTNTDHNVCTSLLVNQFLQGQYSEWAAVGAFGDNMDETVINQITGLSVNKDQLSSLKMLGICLNYNGYGFSIDDLHFSPDVLYRQLIAYASPLDFMADDQGVYQKLIDGYQDDMKQVASLNATYFTQDVAVYTLPKIDWAKRVTGVFANQLANQYPNRAHAIINHNPQNGYQISVRAPINNKKGAGELCALFPTGGGRHGAGGINHLNTKDLPLFIHSFEEKYQS